MMERVKRKRQWSGVWPVLIVASCFFFGGCLGCLFASFASGESAGELDRYLTDYVMLAGEGRVMWSFPAVLWNQGRWLLGCILFGLTGLGVIVLPVLFGLRGFLLAFGVSCFFRLFGGTGLVPALLLFGLPALLWAPGLFLTGGHCLSGSCSLFRRRLGHCDVLPGNSRVYRMCVVVSVLLLVLCVIFECSLLPVLLPSAARILG